MAAAVSGDLRDRVCGVASFCRIDDVQSGASDNLRWRVHENASGNLWLRFGELMMRDANGWFGTVPPGFGARIIPEGKIRGYYKNFS